MRVVQKEITMEKVAKKILCIAMIFILVLSVSHYATADGHTKDGDNVYYMTYSEWLAHLEYMGDLPFNAGPSNIPKEDWDFSLVRDDPIWEYYGGFDNWFQNHWLPNIANNNEETLSLPAPPPPHTPLHLTAEPVTISACSWHIVAIRENGAIATMDLGLGINDRGQLNINNWQNIIALSAGAHHTVGLRADGTVVSTNITSNDFDLGQTDVAGWCDIVAISAAWHHTVGLRSDGTVVSTKILGDGFDHGQTDIEDWYNIIAISAGVGYTVGLRADGSVVATERTNCLSDNLGGVSEWRNITAIAVGAEHAVGLRHDGTVVAVGHDRGGQLNVSEWSDIVAIDASWDHTVGLRADGTVVAVGYNQVGQLNVSEWSDIVAISAGVAQTVGLRADGTVVSTWSPYSAVTTGVRLPTQAATAEVATEPAAPTNNDIAVTVNGQPINFPGGQEPVIIDGRTLVPVRGVFEAMGFDVDWNRTTRQAILTRAGDEIVITIDSTTFTTNGTSYTLDVPAQIIGGRTLVPIRYVLESVGYDLNWQSATRTVVITSLTS